MLRGGFIIHIHECKSGVCFLCVKKKKRSPCVNGLKMVMGHKGG